MEIELADNTKISWADSTWNAWLGCTKISPACDHCYAETWAKRAGMADLWQGRRQRTKTWGEPIKWQADKDKWFYKNGRKRRVFTNSLADFFDNEVPDQWRDDAWGVIEKCPDLDWLIVTKRVSNVSKMLPANWCGLWYKQAIIIITVVTQAEADRDIPRLVAIKHKYPWLRIGLSVEPMLERIILKPEWLRMLDWVICGGESGGNARLFKFEWALRLRDDCSVYGVPFHFKQVGQNHEGWQGITGKGDNPDEWPEELRIRDFAKDAA